MNHLMVLTGETTNTLFLLLSEEQQLLHPLKFNNLHVHDDKYKLLLEEDVFYGYQVLINDFKQRMNF
jgi:hypothetical protein